MVILRILGKRKGFFIGIDNSKYDYNVFIIPTIFFRNNNGIYGICLCFLLFKINYSWIHESFGDVTNSLEITIFNKEIVGRR